MPDAATIPATVPVLPASASWQAAPGPQAGWSLALAGDWRGAGGVLPPPPEVLAAGAALNIDGRALAGWDVALASALWALELQMRRRGVHWSHAGLPEGLQDMLELAAPGAGKAAAPAPPARLAGLREAMRTVAFFGEVLIALARWLRGRARVRAADVLQQLDHTGPRSLGIVVLTCALIGLMLAYMGGAQLGRIGAQSFLADVVTVGMVRELAGLMTGIILAGRIGSAFAAQLATMKAGEEIDALRVMGIAPVPYLVLPRLLALLLVAPPMIVIGALAGVTAGWPPAVWVYGVTTQEYLEQSLRALNATHLGIGLFKGLLYVALVALAGCREGLHAGRSAEAVGAATTSAVVKALVWIVMAACATTVVFTNLGY
jgi:phospholipid/cholesterol/gamma-HCH transport system permease protein